MLVVVQVVNMQVTPTGQVIMPVVVTGYHVSLASLQATFAAIGTGSTPGDSAAAHCAVLDRLTANQDIASASGWTALAIERLGGIGLLHLAGTPASGAGREVVPDLTSAPATS